MIENKKKNVKIAFFRTLYENQSQVGSKNFLTWNEQNVLRIARLRRYGESAVWIFKS